MLLLVAAVTPAAAESRLFSAKASQAGVTIVDATLNGASLPVAGQNGDTTFFRIDNPSGPVPCSNSLRFTASNGQSVTRTVNLCASNWLVTVALAGPVIRPVPEAAPIKPTSQPVAIATDDPFVSINEVFLRGKAVPIASRQEPYVQINLLGGPQGFECSRDLGLALSDGRRIARQVDVCQSNFVVIVALVGGPQPTAPPPNIAPPVIQPPVVIPPPGIQPLPLPQPLPGEPEIVTDMQWLFSRSGNRASFAYAIPETDASEFTAVCQTQSSTTTVTLSRSADEVGPGSKVQVRFTAGTFSRTYTATGSPVSELDGLSHPVLNIATSDPLWAALIKESLVTIRIGSGPAYSLSLSGSAAKARQFLALCSPPPPPIAQPQPPFGGGGNAVGYACDDGSFFSVAYDANSAVVSEPGAQPIFLLLAPSPFGSRYVAGLSELVTQGDEVFWIREGGFARACSPS